MTTLTFPHIDYMQRTAILAFLNRKKIGFSISEPEDTLMTKKQMYDKIDKGVEEYKQGNTKKLDVNEIDSFLGL
jgi:hypothetical protein